MKLIVFPLIFLFCFAMMTQLGLSDSIMEANVNMSVTYGGYYDEGGHQVLDSDGQPTGEDGNFAFHTAGSVTAYFWQNSTGIYEVFDNPMGINYTASNVSFDIGTSLGLIALVIVIAAFSALVGLKILGSGVSDFSVSTIVITTALLTIWGIFSVLAMPLIIDIEILGVVFYFALTFFYTLGIMLRIGGGTT